MQRVQPRRAAAFLLAAVCLAAAVITLYSPGEGGEVVKEQAKTPEERTVTIDFGTTALENGWDDTGRDIDKSFDDAGADVTNAFSDPWGDLADRTKLPDNIIEIRNIWRIDTAFHDVDNMDFCGGTKYYLKGECWNTYLQTMLMIGLPFYIVSAFFGFMAVLAFLGRYLCNNFGGKYPSKGCFKGELKDEDAGYTPAQRKGYMLLLVVIWCLILIAVSFQFSGNATLNEGVELLEDTMTRIPSQALEAIKYAQTTLPGLANISAVVNPNRVASEWTAMYTTLEHLITNVTDFETKGYGTVQGLKDEEEYRAQMLYWTTSVAFLVATMALLGAWCPVLISFSVPLSVAVGILAWVLAGDHLKVAVATADFCVALKHGMDFPNMSTPLEFFVPDYKSIQPGASKFMTHASGVVDRAVTQACASQKALCDRPAVSFPNKHGVTKSLKPVVCPTYACNQLTLEKYLLETRVHDFQFGCGALVFGNIVTKDCLFTDRTTAEKHCLEKYGNTDVEPCVAGSTARFRNLTMSDCASGCIDQGRKDATKEVLIQNHLASNLRVVAAKINYYTTDKFVHDPTRKVEQTLCYEATEACDYIVATACLIALTNMFAFGVYLGAQKRFNTRYSAEHWAETRGALSGGASGQPLLGGPK